MSYLNQKEFCISCHGEVDKRVARESLNRRGIVVCPNCEFEENQDKQTKYREEVENDR